MQTVLLANLACTRSYFKKPSRHDLKKRLDVDGSGSFISFFGDSQPRMVLDRAVVSWLEEHSRAWYTSLDVYSPTRKTGRGNDFELIIIRGWLHLTDDDYIAYQLANVS